MARRTLGRLVLVGGLVAALSFGGAEAAPALVGLLGITPGVVGGFIGADTLGNNNAVTDDFGVVAGGRSNRAGDNAGATDVRTHATVGGGEFNIASGSHATVGGGYGNIVDGFNGFVGGGTN